MSAGTPPRRAANLRQRVRRQAPLQRIAALQRCDPAGGPHSKIRRLLEHPLPLWLSVRVLQPAIQVECGADQSHVRERLREVAQRLATGSDLLRVQSEVVGVG